MKNTIFGQDSFIPNGETKFCYLFGANIQHSLSPEMQTKWFIKHNQNAVYLPFEISDEKDFLQIIQNIIHTKNFIGANFTLPYKKSILAIHSFEPSTTVEVIQAANTLYKDTMGKWYLENTDIVGIRETIKYLNQENDSYIAIVLGGGGAAVSAIYESILNISCKQVLNFTRNPEKTLASFPFLRKQNKYSIFPFEEIKNKTTLNFLNEGIKVILINTLPLGIEHTKNLQGSYLQDNVYAREIIDLVTNPYFCYFDMIYTETKALKVASKKGFKVIDGKLMLRAQAKESFYLWTGINVKD